MSQKPFFLTSGKKDQPSTPGYNQSKLPNSNNNITPPDALTTPDALVRLTQDNTLVNTFYEQNTQKTNSPVLITPPAPPKYPWPHLNTLKPNGFQNPIGVPDVPDVPFLKTGVIDVLKPITYIAIFQPVDYNGNRTMATKSINRIDGILVKENLAKHCKKGWLGWEPIDDLEGLFHLIKSLAFDEHSYILRGALRPGVDVKKLIYRRKNPANYPGKEHTVAFDEELSLFRWLCFDLDHFDLKKLGIDDPVNTLDLSYVFKRIISKYIPELSGISFVYQLSAGCGIDPHELSAHLFFISSTPISNSALKRFAKSVNHRAGFTLLDPALHQAVQPIYTANPIIKNKNDDQMPGKPRVVLCKGKVGQIDSIKITDLADSTYGTPPLSGAPRPPAGAVTGPLYLPPEASPQIFSDWLKQLEKTTGLHDGMTYFLIWLYSICTDGLSQTRLDQVKNALAKSPRCKDDPSRLQTFFDNGEYNALAEWAKKNAQPAPNRHLPTELVQAIISEVKRQKVRAPFENQKKIESIINAVLVLLENQLTKEAVTEAVKTHLKHMGVKELGDALRRQNTQWYLAKKTTGKQYFESNFSHDTCVIDSPVNTGKTEAIKRYLSTIPSAQVLVLTPRMILAKGHAIRMDLQDYEDYKNASPQQRRDLDNRQISTCVNSLLKLDIDPNEIHDVLVIDEIELFVVHLYGDAMKDDRQAILDGLRTYIRNAKKVIVAQDGITSLTIDFLKSCGRTDICVERNTFKPFKDVPLDWHTDEKILMAALLDDVSQGKNVIVACSSLTKSEAIHSELQAEKIYSELNKAMPQGQSPLLITSKNATGKAQQAFMKNPNEEGRKYQVIVHSPALESGLSLDLDEFQKVYGFFKTGHGLGNASSMYQQLFRARKVQNLALYIDSKIYHQSDSPGEVYREVMARWEGRIPEIAYAMLNGLGLKDSIDLDMQMKVCAAERRASNDVAGELLARLEAAGLKINFVRSAPKAVVKTGGDSLVAGKQTQKRIYNKDISLADSITKGTFEEIKRTKKGSQAEFFQMEKYRLENKMALSLNELGKLETSDVLEFWNQGRGGALIACLAQTCLSDQDAQTIDKFYLENYPPQAYEQGFWVRRKIRQALLEFLSITFDHKTGKFDLPDGQFFSYDDFYKQPIYEWIQANWMVVVGSMPGSLKENGKLTKEQIAEWIRGMGIKLKSKRIRLNAGSRTRKYWVDADSNSFLFKILERRWKNNTMADLDC